MVEPGEYEKRSDHTRWIVENPQSGPYVDVLSIDKKRVDIVDVSELIYIGKSHEFKSLYEKLNDG